MPYRAWPPPARYLVADSDGGADRLRVRTCASLRGRVVRLTRAFAHVPSEHVVIVLGMATLTLVQGGWDDSPLWEGWSRFVPRLSWKDRYLLGELPVDRSTTIAKSLAQAGGDAQLVLHAHAEPARRVVLEPEAWHNQRRERIRPGVFRALGSPASLRRMLDPATLRSSSVAVLIEYVMAFVNLEDARHADALLLPYHCAGGHGTSCARGRVAARGNRRGARPSRAAGTARREAEAAARRHRRRGGRHHQPAQGGRARQQLRGD